MQDTTTYLPLDDSDDDDKKLAAWSALAGTDSQTSSNVVELPQMDITADVSPPSAAQPIVGTSADDLYGPPSLPSSYDLLPSVPRSESNADSSDSDSGSEAPALAKLGKILAAQPSSDSLYSSSQYGSGRTPARHTAPSVDPLQLAMQQAMAAASTSRVKPALPFKPLPVDALHVPGSPEAEHSRVALPPLQLGGDLVFQPIKPAPRMPKLPQHASGELPTSSATRRRRREGEG